MLADDGEVPLIEGVAPDEIILGVGYFEQTIALGSRQHGTARHEIFLS